MTAKKDDEGLFGYPSYFLHGNVDESASITRVFAGIFHLSGCSLTYFFTMPTS